MLAEIGLHPQKNVCATLGRAALVWRRVQDLMVSPHVLTLSQSLLRKDTTEESEYTGFPWRRLLPPVAFVPRWVDLKKDHEFPGVGFVVAWHTPTPIQFRVRLLARGSHCIPTRERLAVFGRRSQPRLAPELRHTLRTHSGFGAEVTKSLEMRGT